MASQSAASHPRKGQGTARPEELRLGMGICDGHFAGEPLSGVQELRVRADRAKCDRHVLV